MHCAVIYEALYCMVSAASVKTSAEAPAVVICMTLYQALHFALICRMSRSVRLRYSMHLCKAVAVCSHRVRLRNALAAISGIWVHFKLLCPHFTLPLLRYQHSVTP